MSPPITLYLIGFAGTGKYTIAKEIAKAGYKIVDNHLINNPIFSLLELDGKMPIPRRAWQFIEVIRKAVLGFIAEDKTSHYVLTNELYEAEVDHRIYGQVKEAADSRGSLFVPVKLIIEDKELKTRITNPDRKTRLKITDPTIIESQRELIKIKHYHVLEIEVTHLDSLQVAAEILTFVKSLVHL